MCARCGSAPARPQVHFFLFVAYFFSIFKLKKKNWKKNIFFIFIFSKKCAVGRAGAGPKTGVWMRAPHTMKMCAMCVRVRTKKCTLKVCIFKSQLIVYIIKVS